MIKQIINRFFEWVFLSIIIILVTLITELFKSYETNWSVLGGVLLGYLVCLLFRVPYNKEEIELDNYIEKNNKNGFD